MRLRNRFTFDFIFMDFQGFLVGIDLSTAGAAEKVSPFHNWKRPNSCWWNGGNVFQGSSSINSYYTS